ARRRPQFPRPTLLAACRLDRLAEAAFGGRLVVRLRKQQFALEAVGLGLVASVVVFFGGGQRFVPRLSRLLAVPGMGVGVAQRPEVGGHTHFRSGSAEGSDSFEELRHGFIAPTLM